MIIKNIRVLKFNEPTKNGRIYRESSVNLNDHVLQEQLKNNCLFGEISFPKDRTTDIDMTKVSHLVTALRKEEDGLYADIEILPTVNGKLLEKIVNPDNFRTRGIGTIVRDPEGNRIVENYQLITIDYTNNPA